MNAEWQIFNLTTNTLPPPWQRDQCVLLAGGICAPEAANINIWSITVGPYGSHTRTPSGGPTSTYYTQINRRRHQTVPVFPLRLHIHEPCTSGCVWASSCASQDRTSTQLTSEGKFPSLLKLLPLESPLVFQWRHRCTDSYHPADIQLGCLCDTVSTNRNPMITLRIAVVNRLFFVWSLWRDFDG